MDQYPCNLMHDRVSKLQEYTLFNHKIGKGVGKKLMQTCHEIAKQKGKKILWLGVWKQNQRAIDFYTAWGFEIFGEQEFILGDDVQTDWLMKKDLSLVSQIDSRFQRIPAFF